VLTLAKTLVPTVGAVFLIVMVKVVSLVEEKAEPPMLVTEGIFTLDREVQP